MIITNPKAEFASNILKRYANEKGEITRGTTDISPLEEWLILQLYKATQSYIKAAQSLFNRYMENTNDK